MIYDQTDYSRNDKQTLKKTHPTTHFMENNFENQICFYKLHFPLEFFPRLPLTFYAKIFKFSDFPWLSMTPCVKGTFFPDFPDCMNPEAYSRQWGHGCVFGAHFSEKRAFWLLALPKQIPFLTISKENTFFKTQGTRLGAIVAPSKCLE